MASLASKDSYLQKLGSKVCASQSQEPRKRPFVPYRSGEPAKPRKKPRKRQKFTFNGPEKKPVVNTSTQVHSKGRTGVQEGAKAKPESGLTVNKHQGSKGAKTTTSSSFYTVDILRQRLHEKIEEKRGNVKSQGLSAEERERKRARRKQERERKKRKRKEIRKRKLAEEAGEGQPEEKKEDEDGAQAKDPAGATPREESTLVFNKVDVSADYVDKEQQKKEKKKKVKGNITPLTGKNYKQLLSRLEARTAKLEDLRSKDMGKAKELEEKMKWTNVLYKAEGLKIKDNEELLRASLKRKEKKRTQRKKNWGERSEHVMEKMQHRQDKRRKNLQRQKSRKAENRKNKARKKGRVLPEDLK
ncbi:surfeit locus protein 6 isoform X2 [Amia ocellicauda]